jgi:hypothetical protein
VLGLDVLPRGEEPEELRGRDGLDLLAQTVDRVAVDPGEQAAVAPGLAALDAGPEHDTFRLQLAQQRVVAEDRSQRLHPAAQDGPGIAGGLGREPAIALERDPPTRGQLVEPGLPGPDPPRR